jgi:predicted transcriptional regulator of viral defense system
MGLASAVVRSGSKVKVLFILVTLVPCQIRWVSQGFLDFYYTIDVPARPLTAADGIADQPGSPRELADWLLAHGRHWITTGEVAALLGTEPRHVSQTVSGLRERHALFSPTRGIYVPIPPEFRTWGAPPASHFVDPLMQHLGHPYYVGLLSAAEVHGAAHQRPQGLQIITTARLADRRFGRSILTFIYTKSIAGRATTTVNTPTGTMTVATTETTALDLVSLPHHGGGVSNVATVIIEMLEQGLLDEQRLVAVARVYPAAAASRLGWLLDHVAPPSEQTFHTDALLVVAKRRSTPVLLVRSGPRRGHLDARWNVVVNADVEPDV